MKKILIVASDPSFLGGISLYQKNLIKYAQEIKLNYEFNWIYPGKENRVYKKEGIKCIELKNLKFPILGDFLFNFKVNKFLLKNNFDIINTHANWGYCLKGYKKKENQRIVHTYHGVTYPYMKIQFERFGILKYLFYLLLPILYFLEKDPMKKADKIICVSEKVKKDLERVYWKRKNVEVIRTGVDLNNFKKIPKEKARNELNLEKDKIYGLYSGRGGYWNKGLDRAIKLGKEMYKKDNNFRLIVIGSDERKCSKYLNEDFVLYKGVIKREELNKFYSAADFFFSLSRYEGGAPTLALSEAIASECLTICSKDMNPEILKNEKDCLIIDEFKEKEANEIIELLKNKKEVSKMKKSALSKIKKLNIKSWAEKYFRRILK